MVWINTRWKEYCEITREYIVSLFERGGIKLAQITTGQVLYSSTGRQMSPVPKVDTTSNIKAMNTINRIRDWLRKECIIEAESVSDEFNLLQFRNIDSKKTSVADVEAMNDYLLIGVPCKILMERRHYVV